MNSNFNNKSAFRTFTTTPIKIQGKNINSVKKSLKKQPPSSKHVEEKIAILSDEHIIEVFSTVDIQCSQESLYSSFTSFQNIIKQLFQTKQIEPILRNKKIYQVMKTKPQDTLYFLICLTAILQQLGLPKVNTYKIMEANRDLLENIYSKFANHICYFNDAEFEKQYQLVELADQYTSYIDRNYNDEYSSKENQAEIKMLEASLSDSMEVQQTHESFSFQNNILTKNIQDMQQKIQTALDNKNFQQQKVEKISSQIQQTTQQLSEVESQLLRSIDRKTKYNANQKEKTRQLEKEIFELKEEITSKENKNKNTEEKNKERSFVLEEQKSIASILMKTKQIQDNLQNLKQISTDEESKQNQCQEIINKQQEALDSLKQKITENMQNLKQEIKEYEQRNQKELQSIKEQENLYSEIEQKLKLTNEQCKEISREQEIKLEKFNQEMLNIQKQHEDLIQWYINNSNIVKQAFFDPSFEGQLPPQFQVRVAMQ